MIELFDGHSGIAYIYKEFLYGNQLGTLNERGDAVVSGWTIELKNDEKLLGLSVFGELLSSNLSSVAQFFLNYDEQKIYFDQTNAIYEDNGNIKIEFNLDTVPFDLRNASNKIEIKNVYKDI